MKLLPVVRALDAQLVGRAPGDAKRREDDVGARPLEEVLVAAENVDPVERDVLEFGARDRHDPVGVGDVWSTGERNGVHRGTEVPLDVVAGIERRVVRKVLEEERGRHLPAATEGRRLVEMQLLLDRVLPVGEGLVVPRVVEHDVAVDGRPPAALAPVPGVGVVQLRVRDGGARDEAAGGEEVVVDAAQQVARADVARRA